MVAEINSQAEMAVLQLKNHMTEADKAEQEVNIEINKDKLMHDMQIMDKKFQIEREKMKQQQNQFNQTMQFQKDKQIQDAELKRLSINKKNTKA